LRSCFFASVDSFVNLRFKVPKYGSNPSFSEICFLTHGSSRNPVPLFCPLKTLPWRVTACKCCAFFFSLNKKRRQSAVASWLALFFEPFCDFLEKRVSAHVQNGYLN